MSRTLVTSDYIRFASTRLYAMYISDLHVSLNAANSRARCTSTGRPARALHTDQKMEASMYTFGVFKKHFVKIGAAKRVQECMCTFLCVYFQTSTRAACRAACDHVLRSYVHLHTCMQAHAKLFTAVSSIRDSYSHHQRKFLAFLFAKHENKFVRCSSKAPDRLRASVLSRTTATRPAAGHNCKVRIHNE